MQQYKKLDILAFGAHPDDVEACAGGMLAKSAKEGYKVGILDLTAGENSETASGSTRIIEAERSARTLGIHFRKNLQMLDRGLDSSVENENLIAKEIRKLKPDVVVLPYWHDRHKAHRDASKLVERAVQTAKYKKIMPELQPHKVKVVLYYMIHYEFEPNFVFDISDTHEQKMKALYCHKSQLFNKVNGKYTNELLDPDFMEAWVARSRWLGYISGVKFGEAYAMKRPTGLNSLKSITNLYR